MDDEKKVSDAARELSKKGASKGGIARAQSLTPEQRSEQARRAVETRWAKSAPTDNILKSEYFNDLKIGDTVFKAAVLEDGTRVLTRATFVKAIGRKGKAKGGRAYDDEFKLPVFLTAKNINPFIPDELKENSSPIIFKHKGTQFIGYKAELLPQVCGVFIDADEAGALNQTSQKHIAHQCRTLLRAFATVGIIALIDEATGYQEIRDRIALRKILDRYLTDEWAKWSRTFPDEFYIELFRLKGIPYPPPSGNKPSYVGHWTNDVVYSRLAPGVLSELRKKNPRQESGRRKRTFHQYLTRDYGHPALKEHLSNVTFLMKASGNWQTFYKALQRVAPKYGETGLIPFNDYESDN